MRRSRGDVPAALWPSHGALPPLPLAAAVEVAARLPVDRRLLLALVSRACRSLVREPGTWRTVSLAQPGSGVAPRFVGDALLRAAAAAAGADAVAALCLGGLVGGVLSVRAVAAAAALNAGSLRLLYARSPEGALATAAAAGRLLRAAPRLDACAADVSCGAAEAGALLCRAPPFAALRPGRLKVGAPWPGGGGAVRALAASAAAAAAAGRAPPWALTLAGAPLGCAADAGTAADAALACRPALRTLSLVGCGLGPAAGPALCRLLRGCGSGGGGLASLQLANGGARLLGPSAAGAAPLAHSLCAAPLASLALANCRLWDALAPAIAVVAALIAHPTLATLVLWGNPPAARHRPAAGAWLARLVGADAPALRDLNVGGCLLGDAGLRPVTAALRGCTHLRTLSCDANAATASFAALEFLPNVAANASLRRIKADGEPSVPGLAQAEALVAARPPVDDVL